MRDVHASERLPAHTRVTVIGVARDVTQGQITDGRDRTCAYFATSFTSPGELSILVRGRGQISDLRRQIAAAVRVAQPDATFRMYSLV